MSQGESSTTEKSEVFALGYSLFNILTRGGRPNLQALETVANQLPVRFSDRLSDAIRMSLEPNPATRATAGQIYEFLVARRNKSVYVVKPARVMEFQPLTTQDSSSQVEEEQEEELSSL